MNKLTLSILLSFLLIGDANATIPIVTVSYSRNCLVCSSEETRLLHTIDLPGGTFVFWARTVDCKWGFGGCPKSPSAIPLPNGNPDWVSEASNELFTYASLQIGKGINNGSHSSNVFNTSLNKLFRFVVKWSSSIDDSGNPNESIIVTFEPIN